MHNLATELFTVISSVHGRKRRLERNITKSDLQNAVKYGIKEPSCQGRWKYTYADVVYVTDPTSKIEITSFHVPTNFERAQISAADILDHETAKTTVANNPLLCKSHTVLVVDHSGSMRKSDVNDFVNRTQAVFGTIANDYISQNLRSGALNNTDLMSVILMGKIAEIKFEREPISWVLYNRMVDSMTNRARDPGNFIPALKLAESLLQTYDHPECTLQLIFLSDGRPSDDNNSGGKCCRAISSLIEPFQASDRLSVQFIGFGNYNDFNILRAMNDTAVSLCCQSNFIHSQLEKTSLQSAMQSSSSTLLKTMAITSLSSGRTKKVITKEISFNHLQPHLEKWDKYNSIQFCLIWSEVGKAMVDTPFDKTLGLAVSPFVIGEGAERIVYRLRLLSIRDNSFVGYPLVAKESKYVDDSLMGDKVAFHRTFCETQYKASKLAEAFNIALARLPRFKDSQPPAKIVFLSCAVYVLSQANGIRRGFLVEKMLNVNNYRKWNDNGGGIEGHAAHFPLDLHAVEKPHTPCAMIPEGEEGEELESDDDLTNGGADLSDSSSEDSNNHNNENHHTSKSSNFLLSDIPQAFSHFTYRHSRKKLLVCDLQGVLDETTTPSSPPVFELTDPVIHYRSSTGRERVFGRTDRGIQGIKNFFRTHKCNSLCNMLKKPLPIVLGPKSIGH